MIVASIVLVLIAVGMLIAGLIVASDALLYSSIAASVLAALAIVVGARHLPSGRLPDDEFDRGPGAPDTAVPEGQLAAARPVGRASVLSPPTAGRQAAGHQAARHQAAGHQAAAPEPDAITPEQAGGALAVPSDEPVPQVLTDVQAGRLARLAGELNAEVIVIDGRPRYHLSECLHLLGRDVERLPAAEAVELGFTPCGQCEPATALLIGVPRT